MSVLWSAVRGLVDLMRRVRPIRHYSVILLTTILTCSAVSSAEKSAIRVATGVSTAAAKGDEASPKVTVFYLTNRRRYEDKEIDDTYSGERGKTHFGRCEVEWVQILSSPLSFSRVDSELELPIRSSKTPVFALF